MLMNNNQWIQVKPIPDEVGQPEKHPELGSPSQTWTYRDREGRRTGFVYRFERPDGTKEYRPLAYVKNKRTGRCEWRWQAFDTPRPLYGQERLAQNPEAPILLVEG